MHIIIKLLSWVIVIVIVASACNNNGDLTAMRQVDRDFILKASEVNLAEMELAEIAKTRSTNPAVMTFAETMAIEHKSAFDDLEAIANAKNTAITRSINVQHQAIQQRLSEMSGYTFDTAYLHSQITDHENTVTSFESEISNGSDAQVRDYAIAYLPDIQRHHHKADSISRVIEQ